MLNPSSRKRAASVTSLDDEGRYTTQKVMATDAASPADVEQHFIAPLDNRGVSFSLMENPSPSHVGSSSGTTTFLGNAAMPPLPIDTAPPGTFVAASDAIQQPPGAVSFSSRTGLQSYVAMAQADTENILAVNTNSDPNTIPTINDFTVPATAATVRERSVANGISPANFPSTPGTLPRIGDSIIPTTEHAAAVCELSAAQDRFIELDNSHGAEPPNNCEAVHLGLSTAAVRPDFPVTPINFPATPALFPAAGAAHHERSQYELLQLPEEAQKFGRFYRQPLVQELLREHPDLCRLLEAEETSRCHHQQRQLEVEKTALMEREQNQVMRAEMMTERTRWLQTGGKAALQRLKDMDKRDLLVKEQLRRREQDLDERELSLQRQQRKLHGQRLEFEGLMEQQLYTHDPSRAPRERRGTPQQPQPPSFSFSQPPPPPSRAQAQPSSSQPALPTPFTQTRPWDDGYQSRSSAPRNPLTLPPILERAHVDHIPFETRAQTEASSSYSTPCPYSPSVAEGDEEPRQPSLLREFEWRSKRLMQRRQEIHDEWLAEIEEVFRRRVAERCLLDKGYKKLHRLMDEIMEQNYARGGQSRSPSVALARSPPAPSLASHGMATRPQAPHSSAPPSASHGWAARSQALGPSAPSPSPSAPYPVSNSWAASPQAPNPTYSLTAEASRSPPRPDIAYYGAHRPLQPSEGQIPSQFGRASSPPSLQNQAVTSQHGFQRATVGHQVGHPYQAPYHIPRHPSTESGLARPSQIIAGPESTQVWVSRQQGMGAGEHGAFRPPPLALQPQPESRGGWSMSRAANDAPPPQAPSYYQAERLQTLAEVDNWGPRHNPRPGNTGLQVVGSLQPPPPPITPVAFELLARRSPMAPPSANPPRVVVSSSSWSHPWNTGLAASTPRAAGASSSQQSMPPLPPPPPPSAQAVQHAYSLEWSAANDPPGNRARAAVRSRAQVAARSRDRPEPPLAPEARELGDYCYPPPANDRSALEPPQQVIYTRAPVTATMGGPLLVGPAGAAHVTVVGASTSQQPQTYSAALMSRWQSDRRSSGLLPLRAGERP